MTGASCDIRAVRAFAPGRTEIAGNHVDHQGGRVVAATLDCGITLTVRRRQDRCVNLCSAGFRDVHLDAADTAPREDEALTTAALVRGVIGCMAEGGIEVGGFDAQAESTIPAGSGLSSSAAFELALAHAIDLLFSDGAHDPVELARIGQKAEQGWFGKPCGLMDQLSIAQGGINVFDFAKEPVGIEPLDFDFEAAGYAVCLIDTKCDHSRYTAQYAQVATDMRDVAHLLCVDSLSQVHPQAFFARFGEIRLSLGDAPALRGLHFFNESRLVDERVDALKAGDMDAFLDASRRSSTSSAAYLQNVSTADRAAQPAMIALALADYALAGQGAARIHGGGFGGTIQAFVPLGRIDEFCRFMDGFMGDGSCRPYAVTRRGAHAEWIA